MEYMDDGPSIVSGVAYKLGYRLTSDQYFVFQQVSKALGDRVEDPEAVDEEMQRRGFER